MNTRLALACTLTSLLGLAALGCGNGSPNGSGGDEYDPEIDPAAFGGPIDNPFLPLQPGRTWTFVGVDAGEVESVYVEVTSDTKVILGVTCAVVRDRVWTDGELVEDTFDWFAQDDSGNVWYLGEDSKEYEGGEVVSTEGSWEAGVDGAKPGIIMKAAPRAGEQYRQEYYEDEAEDMAEVVSLAASVTVPAGTFTNCLQTKEWTPLEPGVFENKFYAAGIGTVLETKLDGSGRVELVAYTR